MDAVLAARSGRLLSISVVFAVSMAAWWAWDFTVDDALISLRYAHNWVRGSGWAFNPGQRPSDGVTPLPWPVLLAPFARTLTGFRLLGAAKWMGLLAVLGAVALVARRLARHRGASVGAIALIAPFPLVAWAVSGMETGVATLLVTAAACAEGSLLTCALAAGMAATFRPELLPWALVLVSGRLARSDRLLLDRVLAPVLAAAPWLVVALVRLATFGRASPLATLAKPSDPSHGLLYLIAAGLACGTPLLLASRWRRGAAPVALAALVHCGVVVAVGGDWMPYARLLVPILPSLALVPDYASIRSRILLALSASAALGIGWSAAPAGVHVGAARERVTAALVGLPLPLPTAALDVGFVAVAAGDGAVIDLGGLTEAELAALPGGQTSKRIDLGMLEARGMRSLVTWGEAGSRVVEQRLLQDARFHEKFVGQHVGTLGGREVWVYVRRAP